MATPDTSPEVIPQAEDGSGTPGAPVGAGDAAVAGAAVAGAAVAGAAPDTGRRGKFAGRQGKFALLAVLGLALSIFVLIT